MSSSPTSSFSSEAGQSADPLAPMLDVRCSVAFILGTGTMKVRDCMRLERQHIVPLAQTAGADLEVRVNGITVASGEVVIIDDNTALRISKVTPPAGVEAA
jgi:flagellar motor switch protein FliN